MAIDSTIAVRRAMLALMKHDAALIEIVPALRIYPQVTPANPVYPFVRMGSLSSTPVRATCVDGGTIIGAVHGFAGPRKDGDAIVETAEDHAGRIGAAIAAALDGQQVVLPNGKARILWTGGQLLQDPEEASLFHSVQNFAVRALTA